MWADVVKFTTRTETKLWHYVDIARSELHYDRVRDCADQSPDDCVIVHVGEQSDILTNPGATHRDDALRFVVHLVGDLHQPLHCATDGDRGGNSKPVCYLGSCTIGTKPRNLHFTWDDYVIEGEHPDEDAYVAALQSRIALLS